MNDFMKDRYGVDELAMIMGGTGVVLALIGTIANLDPLTWLALAVILLALARAFSKNGAARRKENEAFRSFANKVPGLRDLVARMGGDAGDSAASASGAKRGPSQADLDRAKRTAKKMWKERKTSHFLKCPNCGQIMSVPKGKGKIRVTCPKCHTKIETKS
ncbi:hypothetical protein [Collinsella stercoris]|uniref:hypothetical protein n=1 Tax=Collinsella stercoris TaxID=147206 RepID=UPI003AF12AA0